MHAAHASNQMPSVSAFSVISQRHSTNPCDEIEWAEESFYTSQRYASLDHAFGPVFCLNYVHVESGASHVSPLASLQQP